MNLWWFVGGAALFVLLIIIVLCIVIRDKDETNRDRLRRLKERGYYK